MLEPARRDYQNTRKSAKMQVAFGNQFSPCATRTGSPPLRNRALAATQKAAMGGPPLAAVIRARARWDTPRFCCWTGEFRSRRLSTRRFQKLRSTAPGCYALGAQYAVATRDKA